MSILNIVVTGSSRADVYADTLATDVDSGANYHMSKVFPLAHLNCVIAGRGLAHTLLYVGGLAHSAITLDALCAAIPGSMAWANAERRKHHPDINSPVLLEQEAGTCIAVVAWNGERIVARIWNGYNSTDPAHAVIDLDQVRTKSYFGPDIQVDTPQLLSDAQMLALARRQVLETRQKLGPDAPIGGRLIAARVTEKGISMRTVGDLEDTEPEFAAVRGAAVVMA